jgi:hypothetical protein
MSEGGFVIKFDKKNKKPERCYAVAFDYDEWSYAVNNGQKKAIPKKTKKVIITVE